MKPRRLDPRDTTIARLTREVADATGLVVWKAEDYLQSFRFVTPMILDGIVVGTGVAATESQMITTGTSLLAAFVFVMMESMTWKVSSTQPVST